MLKGLRLGCIVVAFALFCAVHPARATPVGVTISLDEPGSPSQSIGYIPGYSMYTYMLSTNPSTHLVAGNGFELMGIQGLFNAVAPTNFTVADNLSLGTVTYTYTGPTTGTGLSIDGFVINVSPGYTGVIPGTYAATGTNGEGGTVTTDGTVSVPGPAVSPVPEPQTFAFGLVASAIGALCFFGRRVIA